MPVVHIEWLAGRSTDAKRQLAEEVTEAVARVGGVTPADVWVIFDDVAKENWAIGGRLASG